MKPSRVRRFAALVAFAAIAFSPAFPWWDACASSCMKLTGPSVPACCRPRPATAPAALRAPSCCRPGPANEPKLVTVAVAPATRQAAERKLHRLPHDAAIGAASSPVSVASRPPDPVLLFARFESPPAPPSAFRTVLRI